MKLFTGLYLLLLITVFISEKALCQNNLKEGYIVTTDGDTVKGQIAVKKWKTTPSKITFITKGKQTKYRPAEISSFYTDNLHFISAIVKLDGSIQGTGRTERIPEPQLVWDTLFLQVVFPGEKSLYHHTDQGYRVHFFMGQKFGDTTQPIVPLIFKEYKVSTIIAKNEEYKTQLKKAFSGCPDLYSKIVSVSYEYKPLLSLFEEYHKCNRISP